MTFSLPPAEGAAGRAAQHSCEISERVFRPSGLCRGQEGWLGAGAGTWHALPWGHAPSIPCSLLLARKGKEVCWGSLL